MKHHRTLRLLQIAVLAIAIGTITSQANGVPVITKESLVEMFHKMAKSTPWDLSKPLLWGYFFTDPSKADLEKAAPLLQERGYRIVDIDLSDKEDPEEPDLWWLHVEKIEAHDPDSLHERNSELYAFAAENSIDSYDGMDVGPVPKVD